jgi:cell division protein FtsB
VALTQEKISKQTSKLREENAKLLKENTTLREENAKLLKEKNDKLR